VDARGSPHGIYLRHLADQVPGDLPRSRSTRPTKQTLPPPVITKSLPVPANDGLGLDNVQGFVPVGLEPEDEIPEGSVTLSQVSAASIALQHLDLVAEGDVFEKQGLPGSEGRQQESEEAYRLNRLVSVCGAKSLELRMVGVFRRHTPTRPDQYTGRCNLDLQTVPCSMNVGGTALTMPEWHCQQPEPPFAWRRCGRVLDGHSSHHPRGDSAPLSP
jgi:hypothetical protein